jgi:hypothetical protein
MRVYHSSTVIVKKPDTNHSRENLDFGKGFYMTTLYEQAYNYGGRFKRRGNRAWLNTYELEDNLEGWKILEFGSYSQEWLDFVIKNRSGEYTGDFDLVIGGIANDKVIETINLFFDHLISKEEALGRLKYEKPNIQYCIRSQEMLDKCITFIDSQEL